MSDFPRLLAAELGVTRRQVTRLCAARKIPGAYRTKGGHWRLRKLRRTPECDDRIAAFIRRYTSDGGYYVPSKEAVLIAEATKRLSSRLPDALEFSAVLRQSYLRLPKNCRPSAISVPLDSRAFDEKVHRPDNKLRVKGQKLRQLQCEVTPVTLARELRISVATLYRRYGQPRVSEVCKQMAVRGSSSLRLNEAPAYLHNRRLRHKLEDTTPLTPPRGQSE